MRERKREISTHILYLKYVYAFLYIYIYGSTPPVHTNQKVAGSYMGASVGGSIHKPIHYHPDDYGHLPKTFNLPRTMIEAILFILP